MEYRGKQIKSIEVYDESNNNKVIAIISDDMIELDNGYKIRVVPLVKEVVDK